MRVREVLALGACAALLAGCSTAKADLPGITASPRVTASSPAPEPSPTERTATDLSDPDGLGIVFVDTPELTGPAASAHDAVAVFQVEYWRSWRENAVSPLLVQLASPKVADMVRGGVERNTANGYGYAGVMKVAISNVVVAGDTASATVCQDFSDVEFTFLDGRPSQDFQDAGSAQFERTSFSLSSLDGGATWRPESFTFDGVSC